LKKLVLVKWRKRNEAKSSDPPPFHFNQHFLTGNPRHFCCCSLSRSPSAFNKKNMLQKALVFETHHKLTSEKQHSSNTTGFLGNFPDFPVFPSPVFQLRMKISWVFFLPWRLFRLLAPFWSLRTLQLGAWKDANVPPKKNIGKNNGGTKKLKKR